MRSRSMVAVARVLDRADAGIPAHGNVIIAAAPNEALGSYIPIMRESRHQSRPDHMYWLATATTPVTFERLDARTLRVTPEGGYLKYELDRMMRSRPFAKGDRIPLYGFTIEIESITSDGVSRRPEFAQLDAQVQAARADVSVVRADRLPRITYSLDKGFDSSSLQREIRRQYSGTLAMANIDIPIFDWGIARSRQRQAELRARSVELQKQLTARDLYLQFATARQEAITAAERVENARLAFADAERNLNISIARYRGGEGPITEVTDGQNTLAAQRIALQQALFDYQIGRSHLLEAVGQ
jgi:hypothetical protein